ncbi:MAG: pyridoxal phosphate-dependent aminotransferase [Deltaproteobacteria bacterium]|nr:pyridoxal phosphate-dependent aminotransferase [Deltaproteobacteria bacterium]
MEISKKLKQLIMAQEGWTRKMFEEGIKLKKMYGEKNVYDFSLGNPDVEPPVEVKETLIQLLREDKKGMHRYMENNGYEYVREEIAQYLSEKYSLPFTAKHIFMSVGCAGGLNVVLKSLLNRGDEVIIPTPFFWEFKNYVENFGGKVKFAPTNDDFQLNVNAIEAIITKRTKAILINSPNNPTGVVYREEVLKELASLLYSRRKEGQKIYIISDDAYKKIVYDDLELPNLFLLYDLVISVTSHSKDLALPGERIGYIAISPRIEWVDLLVSAFMISSRALGFVNAPALFQRVVSKFQSNSVDIKDYQEKRDILYKVLVESGFECVKPMGAFYMFPKSPIKDELKFVRKLQEERILVVPGRGFGKKGYFRIAYCVPKETILASIDGFRRIGKKYVKGGKDGHF